MKNVNKLNELFSDRTFVESIKGVDSLPAIYEAVKAEAPDVTMDELEEYLKTIADMVVNGEISEDELDDVAGGWTDVFGVILDAISLGGDVFREIAKAQGYAERKRQMQKNSKKKKKK